MECRDAQFYLRLRRHAADELGPDVTAPLEGHLATCPACAADARAAESFDRAMSSAMRAVPVPGGLRDKLIAHVAARQGALLRRKLYRTATAAAAAVVLMLLGLGVFSSTRPRVDSEEFVRKADEQMSDRKTSTEKWLAAHKLPDRLPLPFDYDLLVHHGVEHISGNDVPVVVFRSPSDSGFAKVYIFREDGRFDLKGIQDAQASRAAAQVIIGQDRFRGATYLIVYTGGPNGLQQFLTTRHGGMGAVVG
jgi:hypothetical protein